jgi:hypothetical protein
MRSSAIDYFCYIKGLRERHRILDALGELVFTVAVVDERLSRSRGSLPPSYHGRERSQDPGMLAHAKFRADVRTRVVCTGFSSYQLVPSRCRARPGISASTATYSARERDDGC